MKSKIRLFTAILLASGFMEYITKPITATKNRKTVEFTPKRFLNSLFVLTFH